MSLCAVVMVRNRGWKLVVDHNSDRGVDDTYHLYDKWDQYLGCGESLDEACHDACTMIDAKRRRKEIMEGNVSPNVFA